MAKSTLAYADSDNSFEKFLRWTNEKEVLAWQVAKLIKPEYTSLLDVGTGNGDLTSGIIDLFSRVVCLEPAEVFYKMLQQRFPGAEVIRGKIEGTEFDETFDFILASHVLIYVENPEDVLAKLYSLLNSGGTLVIIMLERTGQYLQFIDRFREAVAGRRPEAEEYRWEDIVSYLERRQIDYRTKEVVTRINAPSRDGFLSLNDFHFNCDVSELDPVTLEEMRGYLSQYQHKDKFTIEVKHKFIIVCRPG